MTTSLWSYYLLKEEKPIVKWRYICEQPSKNRDAKKYHFPHFIPTSITSQLLHITIQILLVTT